MGKYKFDKCTSVVIGSKLFQKHEGHVFDTAKMPAFKKELEAACKAGYIVEIKETEKPKAASKPTKKDVE